MTLVELLEEFQRIACRMEDGGQRVRAWRKLAERVGFVPRRYLLCLQQGFGHWLVESETRIGQMHVVNEEDGKLSCSCESAHFRKGEESCKHRRVVRSLQERGIL